MLAYFYKQGLIELSSTRIPENFISEESTETDTQGSEILRVKPHFSKVSDKDWQVQLSAVQVSSKELFHFETLKNKTITNPPFACMYIHTSIFNFKFPAFRNFLKFPIKL